MGSRFRAVAVAAAVGLMAVALVAPTAAATKTAAANSFVTGAGLLGRSPTLVTWLNVAGIQPPETHFSGRIECTPGPGKPDKLVVWDEDDRAVLTLMGNRECFDSGSDENEDPESVEGDATFECNGIPGAEGSFGMSDGTSEFAGGEDDDVYDIVPAMAVGQRSGVGPASDDSAFFNIIGPDCDIFASGMLDGGNIQFHKAKGKPSK